MLISKEHFNKIYENNKIGITYLAFIITNECNANCKVCIAKHKFKSSLCKEVCEGYSTCKNSRCCDHIESDEIFYARVEEILKTVNSPYVEIVITGGEPTLSHRFLPLIEIISKHKFTSSHISIETNGANLGDEEIEKAIKENNIQIYLSRYSPNETINENEFNYTDHKVTNEDVKKFIETYGSLISVNSILLKKNISTGQQLLETVDAFKELGFVNQGYVEIMADKTLSSIIKELITYYDEQIVTAEDIRKEILELGVKEICCDFGEAMGFGYYAYNGVQFSLMYSKLDKQHLIVPNNQSRKFLIMPSGEVGIDGIEKE